MSRPTAVRPDIAAHHRRSRRHVARTTGDGDRIGERGKGGDQKVGGEEDERLAAVGKLVKSAVEWGSLWCVSRVSRAVCRVALVSCAVVLRFACLVEHRR